MRNFLMILLITSLKGGVSVRVKMTKDSLTEFMQIACENYIRNSYLLASGKQDDTKAIETLNNRKSGYLSYAMRTAHRVACFSSMYDYAMTTMKQRALMVAQDNNFNIDPKN